MKVLVVDTPAQILLDLEILLIRTIGFSVDYVDNTKAAIAAIRSNSDIVLIISRESLNLENTYLDICSELKSFKFKTPIICRLPQSGSAPALVFDENSLEKNIMLITSLIKEKISTHPNPKDVDSSYIAVKAEQFLNIESSHSSCDVYIKIVRKGSSDRYLKRLHANSTFSKEEVQRYIAGGLKEFYISVDQYVDYINMISVEIIKSMQGNKNENLDIFSLNSFAYETALERLKIFGVVDALTINLANETIKKITKSIEKNESLTAHLKHLKSKTSSFAFFHCFLIALLSDKLSRLFDWYSPQCRDKLVYLAYFHDISLTNPKFSMIHSEADLLVGSLSDQDKEQVMRHALDSALLLEKFKEIPFGLAQLVIEHHGSKKGYGFPESLSTAISPLTIMFIVLEDFANLFIKYNVETNKDIELLFQNLKDKYSNPVYTETLLSLRSLFPK